MANSCLIYFNFNEWWKDEDEWLVNKISSIVKARKDLTEILSNPKSYNSEIIKTERIKDYFACLEYIKKENIYETKYNELYYMN